MYMIKRQQTVLMIKNIQYSKKKKKKKKKKRIQNDWFSLVMGNSPNHFYEIFGDVMF